MMCTIMMHNSKIISPLTIQTITIAQMLSVGGEGIVGSKKELKGLANGRKGVNAAKRGENK